MGVELYEPRKPVVLHAVLWKGNFADLAGMPDFNELAERVKTIDGVGLLIIDLTGHDGLEEEKAEPNRHYIVRGVTGKFWIMDRKLFEDTYQHVPVVMRREIDHGPLGMDEI